jgi:hypothetical protein
MICVSSVPYFRQRQATLTQIIGERKPGVTIGAIPRSRFRDCDASDDLGSTSMARSAATALGVAVALVAGCEGRPDAAAQQPRDAQPPAVTVAVMREQEVNQPFEFVGRAEALQTVDLRASRASSRNAGSRRARTWSPADAPVDGRCARA